MSKVVLGSHRSVYAAYQATEEDIGVSIISVYNKPNGIEPYTSAKLVRYAARQAQQHVKKHGGKLPSPLPGKSFVVYEPVMAMPIDVFPCEDGHAQERSLFKTILPSIEANDAWIADRNFCTIEFTCGIASRGAYFVVREHKNYPWQSLGKEKYIGKTKTGKLYEQPILVRDDSGREYAFRRLCTSLKKKTRDGGTEIFIISNLSKRSADAKKMDGLYHNRWSIGVSRQGHIIQSVKVRPGTKGSNPRSLGGAMAQKQDGEALRQIIS